MPKAPPRIGRHEWYIDSGRNCRQRRAKGLELWLHATKATCTKAAGADKAQFSSGPTLSHEMPNGGL